jgi:hypothetical protein
LLTEGIGGTGFRYALSTSIISPSTDKSFTFSPDSLTASAGVKGEFFELHATARDVNNPAAKNLVGSTSMTTASSVDEVVVLEVVSDLLQAKEMVTINESKKLILFNIIVGELYLLDFSKQKRFN